MKNVLRLFLLAAAAASAACMPPHPREIRRVEGCRERLENPGKREACRECVERPLPHVFLPDNPEGERCVRR